MKWHKICRPRLWPVPLLSTRTAAFFPSDGGPRQAPPYAVADQIVRSAGDHVQAVLREFAEAFGRVFQTISDRLSERESEELVWAREAHRSFVRRRGGHRDLVVDLQRRAIAARGRKFPREIYENRSSSQKMRLNKRHENALDRKCNSVGRLYDLLTVGPLRNCDGAVIPNSEYQAFYGSWPACESCSTGVDEQSLACRSKCCSAVNTTGVSEICRCPADYSGYLCESSRSWSCTFELLSPDLSCSSPGAPINTNVYGDPTCFKFSRADEAATLVFRASCTTTGTIMDAGDQTANFSYYLKTDKLALTNDPKMTAISRPFNFYKLSDVSEARSVDVPGGAYTGDETLQFTFNLSALTERPRSFFSGGRLYVETGFVPAEAGYGYSKQKPGAVHRTFLDFYDIPIAQAHGGSVPNNRVHAAFIVAGIIASLVVVALAVFLLHRAKEKKKAE